MKNIRKIWIRCLINIKLIGEIFNNRPNDLLVKNSYKTLESCWQCNNRLVLLLQPFNNHFYL